MDRRNFIRSASAASAAAATLTTAASATAPGSPRRVALIGAGWYGKCDLIQLINVEPVEVVAIADPDSKMLAEAAGLFQQRHKSGNLPKTYANYKDLLAENEIDIAIVGTPDHWHALATIDAMEAGADVYVQKPTACDVLESKAMVDTARRLGKVVQVGTQRRSTPHLVEAKEKVVERGLLGDVRFAECHCYWHMRTGGNPPDTQPPANLDYDLWTGPAPMRPYNELVHPRSWRAFMEYGNGIVGDMCVHMLDMIRWQLDLGWPRRISSTGGILVDTASKANITDTQTCTFDFDDIDVVWTHRTWGGMPDPDWPWASYLYGTKGTLKLAWNKYEFIPNGGGKRMSGSSLIETDKYPTDLTDKASWRMDLDVASAIRDLMRDFLRAVDNRTKPVADIEQGHISTSACILANNSMELGRTLEFDSETHTVVDDDEANAMLRRTYRTGYTHPADAAKA